MTRRQLRDVSTRELELELAHRRKDRPCIRDRMSSEALGYMFADLANSCESYLDAVCSGVDHKIDSKYKDIAAAVVDWVYGDGVDQYIESMRGG